MENSNEGPKKNSSGGEELERKADSDRKKENFDFVFGYYNVHSQQHSKSQEEVGKDEQRKETKPSLLILLKSLFSGSQNRSPETKPEEKPQEGLHSLVRAIRVKEEVLPIVEHVPYHIPSTEKTEAPPRKKRGVLYSQNIRDNKPEEPKPEEPLQKPTEEIKEITTSDKKTENGSDSYDSGPLQNETGLKQFEIKTTTTDSIEDKIKKVVPEAGAENKSVPESDGNYSGRQEPDQEIKPSSSHPPADGTYAELVTENNYLRKQVKDLTDKLQEEHAAVEEKTEANDLSQRLAETSVEITRLNETVTFYEQALAGAREIIQEYEDTPETSAKKISELESELRKARGEYLIQKGLLEDKEAELFEAGERNSDVLDVLINYQETVKRQKEKIKKQSKDIKVYEQGLAEQIKKIADLDYEKSSNQGNIDGLLILNKEKTEQIKEDKKRLSEQKAEIAGYKARLLPQEELEKLRVEVTEREERLDAYELKCEQEIGENRDIAEKERSKAEKEKDRHSRTVKGYVTRLKEIREELTTTQERLNSLQEKYVTLQEEQESLQEVRSGLEDKLKEAQEGLKKDSQTIDELNQRTTNDQYALSLSRNASSEEKENKQELLRINAEAAEEIRISERNNHSLKQQVSKYERKRIPRQRLLPYILAAAIGATAAISYMNHINDETNSYQIVSEQTERSILKIKDFAEDKYQILKTLLNLK